MLCSPVILTPLYCTVGKLCIYLFVSILGALYVWFSFFDLTVACKLIDPLLHEDSEWVCRSKTFFKRRVRSLVTLFSICISGALHSIQLNNQRKNRFEATRPESLVIKSAAWAGVAEFWVSSAKGKVWVHSLTALQTLLPHPHSNYLNAQWCLF